MGDSIRLVSSDHPCANGKIPSVNERWWDLHFSLEDNKRLILCIGESTKNELISSLLADELKLGDTIAKLDKFKIG